MRPREVVRSVLLPALVAGAIVGGGVGVHVGYLMALADVTDERVAQVEGHTENDAALRVACAQGVVWAERWQDVAIQATESRVGPTGGTHAGAE